MAEEVADEAFQLEENEADASHTWVVLTVYHRFSSSCAEGVTMLKVVLVLIVASTLVPVQSVLAQNLGPADPDVVMECFLDEKRAETCQFACGTELAQGGGKETVSWGGVTRVEFFHKGAVGRTDTRSWVFVQLKTGPKPVVAALYIGPNVFCHGSTGGENTPILKMTRFRFN
jgi:hypothetical protein